MVNNKSPPPAKTDKGKKPPSFSSPQTIVNLFVGTGENAPKFTVHKEFVCFYSPVMGAAFNSNFKEGQTQTYHLEDTSEDAVRLLVFWIYSQNLNLPLEEAESWDFTREIQALCSLWVLADKLIIAALQNAVIEKINAISLRDSIIPTFCIQYIYQNTAVRSPLRQLMLTYCAYSSFATSYYTDNSHQFPKEMLLELTALLIDELPPGHAAKRLNRKDMSRFKVSEA